MSVNPNATRDGFILVAGVYVALAVVGVTAPTWVPKVEKLIPPSPQSQPKQGD